MALTESVIESVKALVNVVSVVNVVPSVHMTSLLIGPNYIYIWAALVVDYLLAIKRNSHHIKSHVRTHS